MRLVKCYVREINKCWESSGKEGDNVCKMMHLPTMMSFYDVCAKQCWGNSENEINPLSSRSLHSSAGNRQ